jgi:hypothetical protein
MTTQGMAPTASHAPRTQQIGRMTRPSGADRLAELEAQYGSLDNLIVGGSVDGGLCEYCKRRTCGGHAPAPGFKVGEGNRILAQISDAAAELLLEARVTGTRFGVELGGTFDKATARELEDEDLGSVKIECETHGFACPPQDDCWADTVLVFVINDAGEEWLDDAGKI